ncbi:MAG: exonuclease SbcD [Gammaproteobacteria bacterium]|jgi:exonuclease SbcD
MSRDQFTFLHAADVHLDSPLRGLSHYDGAPVEAIRRATRAALRNLVDRAIADSVNFVVIAGDLYDGDWKDYNTGLYFIAEMSRLREYDIDVFLVAGNHDAASQISRRLRLPENVVLFAKDEAHTHLLEGLDVAVHGQSYARREVTDDLSRNYPAPVSGRFNIGVLHTALDGRVGHASYAPCSEHGLRASGYQYWALGHVHKREVVANDPWIVFPGNLQGRHALEDGAKGATRVVVEDGDVTCVEHIALDEVRWFRLRVDVSDADSPDEALALLERRFEQTRADADGRLALVRVTFTGVSHAHARLRAERDQVVAECRALATGHGGSIWVEKVRFDTRAVATVSATAQRDDAFGELLRAINALDTDDEALMLFASTFEDLRKKLPAELLHGDDAFDPTSTQTLREALEDVKALLVERLLMSDE